ncbi:hypothetical protein ACW9HH_32800 [Nocardia gipuzkoensis]
MTLPAPAGGEPAAAPDPGDDPTLNALRPLIFGDEYTLHVTVRYAVMALGDVPASGIAYPRLVRRLVGALGGSAEVISADPWLRGALCEWVAVAAPRLLPMVSAEFHTSSGTALQDARMDLANASMASARAAVAMLVDHGPWVNAVRHDVVSAIAAIYVATAVGVEARDRVGAGIDGDPAGALWAMLAKAQLSETCRSVLAVCRLHASQTVLVDHLPDWECLAEGICGAAGRNLDLAVAAGGLPRHVAVASAPEGLDVTALTAWEAPAALPWWHAMLREREQAFAAAVRESRVDVFGTTDFDSLAVQMAEASWNRLAVECLAAAAQQISDPQARDLVGDLVAFWALEKVKAHGLWHAAYGRVLADRAALVEVDAELTRCRTALTQRLPLLVRAFDVPRLPAPILSVGHLAARQRNARWEHLSSADAEPAQKSGGVKRDEVSDASRW